jgi:hypothetical protein
MEHSKNLVNGLEPEFRRKSDLEIITEATDDPEAQVKEMMSRYGNIQPWAACVNTVFAAIVTHTSFMAMEKKITAEYEKKVNDAYAGIRRDLELMTTAYPFPEVPPQDAQKEVFSLISSLRPNPEDLL